ncbi:uncharacterized protein LOC119452827 [Dermacentor silvarum]|uniref:uncharacterized protein LOC119452827 n=1 Tax=Dermacentor silvarum TaxID=543639 RepID=UPI00189A5065|nr:uncharacterized protein LOC119452827 [Dermacentor silvarum]
MAESGSVIRVKLDLRSALPRRGPHDLVWSIVDKAVTTTIRQFEKFIRTKYGVPRKSELYLDDALLPPDEPIQILSDKDTVRVVTAAQQPSNSDSHADDDPESSLTIDEPIKTEVKRERPEIGEPINEEVKRESPEINEPIKTEVKRERPKIGEPIKTEVKQEPPESHDTPVVETDEVSGSAGPGHSNSFESTTKQDVTPCFAVSQVKSTPTFYIVSASTTPQNQSPASTPGWPVFTPDPGLQEPRHEKVQATTQEEARLKNACKSPSHRARHKCLWSASPRILLKQTCQLESSVGLTVTRQAEPKWQLCSRMHYPHLLNNRLALFIWLHQPRAQRKDVSPHSRMARIHRHLLRLAVIVQSIPLQKLSQRKPKKYRLWLSLDLPKTIGPKIPKIFFS